MSRRSAPASSISAVQFALLIPRLRTLAARLLSYERPGHTLQATALVNEAYLKLRQFASPVVDERHLFNLCARAMRQVLVDHGRARKARGRVTLDSVANSLACVDSAVGTETEVAVRALFAKLQKTDPVVAGTLKLRFIQGLTIAEISLSQKRPEWRVRADCNFGLKWIQSNFWSAVP